MGQCDHPSTPGKAIRISKSLRGLERLDTLIHEMLHAAAWEQFDEDFVEELGRDIAHALWRIGYRDQAENNRPSRPTPRRN